MIWHLHDVIKFTLRMRRCWFWLCHHIVGLHDTRFTLSIWWCWIWYFTVRTVTRNLFWVFTFWFGRLPRMAALFQRWIAGSGLNSLTSADSKLILIRAVTASSVKQFCQSVLVILSKENPLSHSEECAGIVSSKSINRRKFGAILLNAMLICSQLTSFPIFLRPYLKM